MAQIIRFNCDIPNDNIRPGILCKKVDWGDVSAKIANVAEENGGWDRMVNCVDELSRRKSKSGRGCGWWCEELEGMAMDVRMAKWERKPTRTNGNLCVEFSDAASLTRGSTA